MDRSKSKKRFFLNTLLGIFDKLLICILGLVLRRVFLNNLGAELSGLSSLFQNIIEFLNLATAGFTVALFPRLYQYNAIEDYNNINKTMKLLTRFYYMIGIIIFLLGIGCSFFLDQMIYDNSYSLTYLRIVFLIQVLTQCIRLLTTPNTALLGTREQGYYFIIYDIIINLFIYVAQIWVIIKTQNYIYYLLISLIGYILLNLMLSHKVYQLYPWLKEKVDRKVEKITDLVSDIKYTVIMKIADFIFCSTDSIVISGTIGLVQVNAYGNYMTIATAVVALYSAFEGAIKNFFGNKLMVSKNKEDTKEFIELATFAFYLFGTFCGTIYVCIIGDFVHLWVGQQYVQSQWVNILFAGYLFAAMMFCAPQEYLQIFGIFKQEMYANISSAVVNLLISLILIKYFGIAGVLIGTLAGFTVRFIQRGISCFKDMEINVNSYFLHSIIYILVFCLNIILVLYLCSKVAIDNIWLSIICKSVIGCIIPFISNIVLFSNKKEMKIIVKMLRKIAVRG